MESMSDELHTQPFYHIETISYLAQRKALRLIINVTMNTSDTGGSKVCAYRLSVIT